MIEELLERKIGIAKYFSDIVIKWPFIKTHCSGDTPFFPLLITG
jgi:hypothetical protein